MQQRKNSLYNNNSICGADTKLERNRKEENLNTKSPEANPMRACFHLIAAHVLLPASAINLTSSVHVTVYHDGAECRAVTVPSCTRVIKKSKGPLKVPKDKLPQFAQLGSRWMPRAQDLKSEGDIEQFAQDLCRALVDALKAVGKASNGRSGRSAPWWTPECKAARLRYRTASTEPDRNQYAKAYRDTIAEAKKEYWKSQVEEIKSPSDIYRLMCPKNVDQVIFLGICS
ncbi:hypothetical protein K3495_g14026 [Podosphaera aphanis]|nr:hypothetical protein K3495_g14026 [Podosphaera aphanis]